ncbi:MAG: thioesterase family protein [Balneolaceae bacterium]
MVTLPDQPPLQSYIHPMRSRYSETDRMGYVYYGRYLEFFEVARTEMVRSLGLPYKKMEEEGILLPVVYTEISYKSPIHYDELMQVKVKIYEAPAVRLKTWYEIFTDTSDRPHVLGRVVLAFMDADTRRPCRAPEAFLNHFSGK